MRYPLLIALTVALFFSPSLNAQESRPDPYADSWRKADSLMDKGLPLSASEIARKIMEEAKSKKDAPNKIKAQLFLMNADQETTEHAEADAIRKAEMEIPRASGVEKAVWQSIAAQMYWNYYRQNRYKLLSRTALEETISGDPDTWDAPAFFRKIAELYRASLSDKAALQQTPVEQYAPLIEKGVNTRKLRPTLYDLLVFRALDFFQNEEKEVINPAYHFVLDGTLWFESASSFSSVKVKVKDGSSLHFQALQLYQEVIAFHLKDAQPDALIDADLQRLQFVHSYSVNAGKDSLYLNALKNLERNYAGNPAVAEVSFQIAMQQLDNTSGEVQPFYRSLASHTSTKLKRDIPAVKKKLEQIIAQYPNTEGGIHAQNALLSLEAGSLELQVEEVNIPDENIKALVTYKNAGKVYLKLFRIPNETGGGRYESGDDRMKEMSKLTPLNSWMQNLPGSEDMEQHATEIKLQALPAGRYLLAASLLEDPAASENLVTVAEFQVSALSLITQPGNGNDDTGFWVLNRESGRPVVHAQLIFRTRDYNNKLRKYELRKIGTAQSDEQGRVLYSFKIQNTACLITIIAGKDTLQTGNQYFYNYRESRQEDQDYTFFFTDRSIYRPGQTVYFKGIVVRHSGNGRKSEVVPNSKTSVGFFDANGQKISEMGLVTNEFGSFTGTFTAPESGLTGQMSIRGGNGQVYFSVEEYKRPRFYVEIDTLRGDYALNQKVRIKGFAKAYAGNAIDGATVKYRVVRRARFPFYWAFYRWGMPVSAEMEITNGTAATASDGSFELEFKTIPDPVIDPETFPVFTYTVYADITDINGETRSGSQPVNAGYVSLQITADLKENSRPEDMDSIRIATQNLNGVFVPAPIKVTMAPLRFPGKIYRERLWERPDQFAMTESEFRQAFPDDEYRDEGDYHNWEKEDPVFEKSYTTQERGSISIPRNAFKNAGWYVLEISAKDSRGKDVVEKKYAYISIPGREQAVQKPLIIQSDKESYQPGETAELELATGFRDIYLLNASSVPGNFSKPGRFGIRIGEDDRGGIGLTWLYVYNNRVYTASRTLDIPWSIKDLQLEWATHRDKLLPGATDEWTLTIKGDKKEKVAAELLTGMYDASLDAFKPHVWSWNKLTPHIYFNTGWNYPGFGMAGSTVLKSIQGRDPLNYDKRYDVLNVPGYPYRKSGIYYMRGAPGAAKSLSAGQDEKAEAVSARDNSVLSEVEAKQPAPVQPGQETPSVSVPIRKNLQETVFFFPQLQTDADGNVRFRFSLPEALTEWRLMAFAHTKDWKTGYLEGKIKTQKDLMVMPNLPRFLRQGDDLIISTKISNLSDRELTGTAALEIVDAETLQPLDLPFRLTEKDKTFVVKKGRSAEASWSIHIPESRYSPVVLRVLARAGNFTDGEENTLPVITNRVLVTETFPLPVRGAGTKHFIFDKLKIQNSNSLLNHNVTVEFTGNPAWYAVQALPYLMEYPYECAEQTFNRFYANALAAHIVARSPKIEQIFDQWKTGDTAALLSNLQKNQELKSALLEETPWVMEAKSETEQKHRIALLFETHQLAKELKQNLRKLEQMQMPEGAFPWFNGMRADRYITQYIITGIARLQYLGVANSDYRKTQNIVAKALPYLDEALKNDYDELLRQKADLSRQHIGYDQIQYLYMRSFLTGQPVPAASKKAFAYYQQQAATYWNQFNPYMKGMIALALNRLGDTKTPQQVMASLKETAINNEETGMYWKNMPRGYWWYEAPVEAQALLIEAFSEVAHDDPSTDAMKVWLLKQKQTQNWETTKATADACYALLLNGGDWLTNEPEVTIQLGTRMIRSSDIRTEAGTGYFKERIPGAEVRPEMGDIEVKVDQVKNEGVSWGAVYWQYFEDMDKVTAAVMSLSLKKQLFIERNTDRGPVLTAIKDGNELEVGDKVKIRIELRVDRDMEYVHLKDMRAACFEPVNVLSGYHYQGGLGYYESTKDVSSNFFFDYLPKGTYVFEYPVFVGQKGDFSNGISTVQCMYAPEFSSHSEGIRVQVK